jgi:hypothetical protein
MTEENIREAEPALWRSRLPAVIGSVNEVPSPEEANKFSYYLL